MSEYEPKTLDRADYLCVLLAMALLATVLTLILIHKVREDEASSKKNLEEMSHSEAGDTFMDPRKGLLR